MNKYARNFALFVFGFWFIMAVGMGVMGYYIFQLAGQNALQANQILTLQFVASATNTPMPTSTKTATLVPATATSTPTNTPEPTATIVFECTIYFGDIVLVQIHETPLETSNFETRQSQSGLFWEVRLVEENWVQIYFDGFSNGLGWVTLESVTASSHCEQYPELP